MIKISRSEKDALEAVGLLKFKRKTNYSYEDANFAIVNKTHKGKNKHYYVVELPEILLFLGRFESLNLQKIREDQLQILIQNNLITENNIQHAGEYKPEATVFIDSVGQIRCKKITEYMIAMNIWRKNNKESITHD